MTGTVALSGGFSTSSTSGFNNVVSGTLDGTIWSNSGTLSLPLSIGPLTLINGASLQNQVGGVITLSSTNPTPIAFGTGGGSISNAGTFDATAAGTQTITADFTNTSTGTLNVANGVLDVAGAFTQSGTLNIASGATFSKVVGFSNAGTIIGTGTMDLGGASLINDGLIAPAGVNGTGTLSITGNLVMGAGSIGQLAPTLEAQHAT